MMTKAQAIKAKNELIQAGWTQILSSCNDQTGLKYGSLFTKEGKEFWFNKDTYMNGFSGDVMAELCSPIFNK